MNFKTTIALLVALVVVGIFFFVGQNKPKPEAPANNSISTAGQGQKLFDLNTSQVKGISITDVDGNRVAVKQDGAVWKMTDPIDATAVDWQTQDLIRTICDLRSEGKPDSAPSDTGLDKPQYTVDLTTTDDKTTRLVIGNKTGVGDVMYAQVDNGDINLIDSSLAKTLKTAGDDLRDKHLLTTGTTDVKQVEIVTPGQILLMAKFGDKWKVTSPQEMPGDSDQISSLISTITGTEATEFVKNDSDDLPFAGFDHPAMTVWISTDAPSTQPSEASSQPSGGITLTVGAPDSLTKDHYFAKTSDGLIAKIATSSLDGLRKTPLDVRDRDVLNVTAADVQTISLLKETYPPPTTEPSKSGAATQPSSKKFVALARRPKEGPKPLGPSLPSTKPAATQPTTEPAQSVWMFTEPAGSAAQTDDSKVDALLGKLSPLHADKFLDKTPTTAFDTRFLLTLQTKSDGTIEVEIVKPVNGGTPYGVFNGLTFELPTTVTDALDVDFHKGP
jgi:hypothetical protein